MEFNDAIQLIEKKEYVGIVMPEEHDFDISAAAEVLLQILEEEGKIVGVLSRTRAAPPLPELLPRLAAFPELPKDFVVSLATGSSEISQLRYEKGDEALDIVISPKRNSLEEQLVSFRQGKIRCDVVITLGVPDIEALANSVSPHPEFFTQTPLINIDIAPENKQYGEVQMTDQARASISEIVYDFATAWREKPLSPNHASLILAAIYAKTNSLRHSSLHPDTLLAASELLRIGAEHNRAQALARQEKPVSLVQLGGRAAVRSKLDETRGILWSFLTAEDFEKTGRAEKDVPQILDALRESFPPHRISVLLTQEEASRPILATLLGEPALMSEVQTLTPASFHSPHLRLENSFSTFREGEEFISTLFEHILS